MTKRTVLASSSERLYVSLLLFGPQILILSHIQIVLDLNVDSSQSPIEVLARIPAGVLPLQDPATPQDKESDPRRVVALRQGHLLLTTFHPELTRDSRFHEYFLSEIVVPLTPIPSTPSEGSIGTTIPSVVE